MFAAFSRALLGLFIRVPSPKNSLSQPLEVFACFPAFDVFCFSFHTQIMRLSPSLRKTLIASLIAPRPDIQELIRAIRDANETNQLQREDQRNQLVKLQAKNYARETAERYNRRYHHKYYCVQVWLTVGTWLAFAAAAIYAGIAAKQWQTMHETYGEIQKQTSAFQEAARAASTQATLMHQQLSGTQGAAVHFDYVSRVWPLGGNQGEVSVLFSNDGKIPAKKIIGTISLSRVRVPEGDLIANSETSFPIDIPILNLGDTQVIPRVAPLFNVLPNDKVLYRDAKIAIVIEVRIQYNNGFDDLISDSRCDIAFNTAPDDAPPTTPASLMSCVGGKRLDSILKQKTP